MHEELPVLYSFRRCPYAMRARMALLYAGIDCELREVSLKNKPRAMLECSPKGTVPVLVLSNQTVIDESLEIMLWAIEQNDPLAIRGSLRTDFVAGIQSSYVPLVTRFKYQEVDATQEERLQVVAEVGEFLQKFDIILKEQGYFSSEQWGLTDIAVLPFIRQCAGVDPEWFEAQSYPYLQQWLGSQLSSSLFVRCMQKESLWLPGEVIVRFPKKD